MAPTGLPGIKNAGKGKDADPFSEDAQEPVIPSATGLVGNSDESFEFDLTDVKTGFRLISAKRHAFRIVEFENGMNKAGTGKRFEVTLRVLGGEESGLEQKTWLAQSSAALWKLTEFLEALGLAKAGSIAKFNRTQVVDQVIEADIEHEPYDWVNQEGKTEQRTRANVKRFYAASDASKQLLEAALKNASKAPSIP